MSGEWRRAFSFFHRAPEELLFYRTSVGPAAVPVSVVRAVRDAGSARQSGPLRICILVLGCRRSSISTHVSSVSHVSQSSRGTWSSRCMQRRRHTLRTTPTHRHTTHNGRLSRTRASRRKQLAAQMGGRQNPTHTGAAQTPYTSALARCGRGALPSVLSRLFNGGVRPRAASSRSRRETSEPHAMRACAMAPLAPCLRQID